MCTFTRVGGRYVIDANVEEETGGEERVHITLAEEGHLHSLQKGLKGNFDAAEFAEILEVAQNRCAELADLVKSKEAKHGKKNTKSGTDRKVRRSLWCKR